MMSVVSVYYRPTDGEIHSVTNGEPAAKSGLEVTRIALPDGMALGVNSALHRIDPDTGDIVDKTPFERSLAARPTTEEIKAERSKALLACDPMMLPDRDLPEAELALWKAYRIALRNLTKDASGAPRTAMEMFEAFPVAPDGTDAVWWIRKRMEQAV